MADDHEPADRLREPAHDDPIDDLFESVLEEPPQKGLTFQTQALEDAQARREQLLERARVVGLVMLGVGILIVLAATFGPNSLSGTDDTDDFPENELPPVTDPDDVDPSQTDPVTSSSTEPSTDSGEPSDTTEPGEDSDPDESGTTEPDTAPPDTEPPFSLPPQITTPPGFDNRLTSMDPPLIAHSGEQSPLR